MIITKNVTFKINGKSIKYYKNLGYDVPYKNAEVKINVNDLLKGSGIKIKCKCDICKKINTIPYSDYNQSIENGGYYSCSSKCSIDKTIKNSLKKYGVEYPFQSEIVKDKIKKTNLERYGIENPGYTEENSKKIKKTNLKKYGCENVMQNKEIIDKVIKTNLERYGIEHPQKLNNIKEKSVKTNLKRYGVECYTQTDEYKTRTKQTRLEKYGNENYNNNIRSKETCLKRYGVEYPQQNLIFFNKQQISGFKMKKYKETNLTYQGTYELDFINEYYNKINIENGPTIRYNDNKVYFPDFYLPEYNLIVEIKSEYYYNQYLSKNLEKQKACLKQGYNFIFIVNKDYTEFNKLF